MNPELRSLLTKLKKLGNEEPIIDGIIVFGSLARGEDDYFSDGDFIIYITENNSRNIERIKAKIKSMLKYSDYDILMDFNKYTKWIIFAYKLDLDYLIKLEFVFSHLDNIKNDVIYLIQSRIKPVEDAVIVDKSGILEKLKSSWFTLEDHIRDEFYNLLNSFVYYYDEFLSRFTRGDVYRAYMNYTISFYKLAGMAALAHGEYRNLYQPWFLTRDVIKDGKERSILTDITATMNPIDMFNKKQKLVDIFIKYAKDAAERFDISFDVGQYSDLMNKINEKYYEFYNFRDVSKIVNFCSTNKKIKKGLVYRTASLSRYGDDIILSAIKNKNICCIIDLRDEEEIERYKKQKRREYGKEIKKIICPKPLKTNVKIRKYNDPYKNLYYALLEYSKENIGEIFNDCLSRVDEGGIIIHCEGGKDRTGIIVALLLDVIGVDRECIIEDYLHSFSDTLRENIEFLFTIIDNYGGSESYLIQECGVRQEVINRLRKVMKANEDTNNR